jgi:hypothetical protein
VVLPSYPVVLSGAGTTRWHCPGAEALSRPGQLGSCVWSPGTLPPRLLACCPGLLQCPPLSTCMEGRHNDRGEPCRALGRKAPQHLHGPPSADADPSTRHRTRSGGGSMRRSRPHCTGWLQPQTRCTELHCTPSKALPSHALSQQGAGPPRLPLPAGRHQPKSTTGFTRLAYSTTSPYGCARTGVQHARVVRCMQVTALFVDELVLLWFEYIGHRQPPAAARPVQCSRYIVQLT